MVECINCGAEFAPRNSLHKFCSRKCKWTVANKKRSSKTERVCPGCGKDISEEFASKKYCSTACRSWVKNGNTELRVLNTNCVRCGTQFASFRAGKKYCSVTCKKMAGNERRGPSNAERYLRERDHRLSFAKRYAMLHPEVGQAAKRRRKALLGGNGSYRFSGKDWKKCLARHGNRCAYCGGTEKLSMDHVVPVTKGGTHGAGNIVPACMSCNASKGNKLLIVWKRDGMRLRAA